MKLSSSEARQLAAKYGTLHAAVEDVEIQEGAVDHVVMDPPYAQRVEDNARRGHASRDGISEAMPLGFDAATRTKRAGWSAWAADAARRWVIVFTDHESSMDWANHLERAGLVYVRCGLWVRTGDAELSVGKPSHSGAPQFTGDRPAAGHEVIVIAHKPGRMRWHGGGRSAVYPFPVVPHGDRVHPTQKPVALMEAIVSDFCSPGDTIADPFCGSGSTLCAAKALGVAAFGIDSNQKFASFSARRAAGFTARR